MSERRGSIKGMEEKPLGLDMQTPINASLTAFFVRSFAHMSVKSRLPTLIGQTVDIFSRKKEDLLRQYGEEAEEDFNAISGEWSKLKADVQQNKPLRKLFGTAPDIAKYNRCLDLQSIRVSQPTFFNINWLFIECYIYRRMTEAIENTTLLREVDPFQIQKEDAFFRTVQAMGAMASYVITLMHGSDENRESECANLIKLTLWGNKCDLSLMLGRLKCDTQQLIDLDKLNKNILCDDTLHIWDALIENSDSQIVDIILDNTAYELFTDMVLADFIIRNKYAQQVRFYPKSIPWFISDVTARDFHWTLYQMKVTKNSSLKKLGERFNNYLRIKAWTLEEHDFWTLPLTYRDMSKWDLPLYRKLSEAKLIIFKGDVNYRKLFGERNWLPTTTVQEGLEGFHPSKLCIMRTLKAQIICGLPEGLASDMEQKEKDWMISGNYGVIQFCDTVIKK